MHQNRGDMVTGKKMPIFALETVEFLWDITRVLCPPLITGFLGPQNPVTRYGRFDIFGIHP